MKSTESITRSLICNTPADLNSEEAKFFKKNLMKFPDEALYVYSFAQNKMIYADGWFDLLGIEDGEMGLLDFIELTTPEYRAFTSELNDKALLFLMQKDKDLEKYSFTIELKKYHKNGTAIPLIVNVGVYKSENGKITQVIGRGQRNKSIKLGKVMRYAAYGPEKSEFEEQLNKELFHHYAISRKEKETLELISKGYSYKEIAHLQNVSMSAIEKRVLPMFKRFDVKSITHLVTFAHENHILP